MSQDNANLFWDDTNDRVGIGTNTPEEQLEIENSAAATLKVSGFGGDADNEQWQVSSDGSGTAFGQLTFRDGDTDNVFTLNGDGAVGVGTETPLARFESDFGATEFSLTTSDDNVLVTRSGASSGNDTYGGSYGFHRNSGTDRVAAIASVQTATDGDVNGIAFFTHPSALSSDTVVEQMRIEADGAVGIGTVVPAGLHSIGGTNGQQTTALFATTELTGLVGASVTASNLIPAGAFIAGVTIRVTTTITGATTFQVGDGSDPDRWGNAITLAAGTTTTAVNFTATGFGQFATANDVVLTATGANFTAGAVRITIHILASLTAPTD